MRGDSDGVGFSEPGVILHGWFLSFSGAEIFKNNVPGGPWGPHTDKNTYTSLEAFSLNFACQCACTLDISIYKNLRKNPRERKRERE